MESNFGLRDETGRHCLRHLLLDVFLTTPFAGGNVPNPTALDAIEDEYVHYRAIVTSV